MLSRAVLLAVLLTLAGAIPASAGVFTPVGGVTAPKGIVLAPDHASYWVAEQNQVTQVRTDGSIGKHMRFATAGTHPAKLVVGPGEDIWGTSDRNLFHFDPDAADGTLVTEIAPKSPCATEGIAAADAFLVLYTEPACAKVGVLAIFPDGSTGQQDLAVGGAAHAVIGAFGKGWVPVPSRDQVVRFATDNVIKVEAETHVAGGPTGIGPSPRTQLLVSLASGGFADVRGDSTGGDDPKTLLYTPLFPVGRLGDMAGGYTLSSGTDLDPRGKVVWMSFDGKTFSANDLPDGGVPGGIAPGPGGFDRASAWLTDTKNNRVLRYEDGPPKVTTADGPKAIVDPLGNDSSVWIDYGKTGAYGSKTAAVSASGSGPREIAFALGDLAPGTTYHFRAHASSVRGETGGEDRTFTTPAGTPPPAPPPPAPLPKLTAKVGVTARHVGRRIVLTRLRVRRLVGGETIVVGCSSRRLGCPFTRKTVRAAPAGSLDLLAKVRRARFRKGARLTFAISRAGYATSVIVVPLR